MRTISATLVPAFPSPKDSLLAPGAASDVTALMILSLSESILKSDNDVGKLDIHTDFSS